MDISDGQLLMARLARAIAVEDYVAVGQVKSEVDAQSDPAEAAWMIAMGFASLYIAGLDSPPMTRERAAQAFEAEIARILGGDDEASLA